MYYSKRTIEFVSADKSEWLSALCRFHQEYSDVEVPCKIILTFSDNVKLCQIEPMHLVTLACLIQYLFDKGHSVYISNSHKLLCEYLYNDLNFSAYWSGGQNHVNARSSENIFNLWRIVNSEKELYAKNVEDYFNRNYFKEKDLSAISVSLIEAFYNVFDHANANKNAFSLLRYDVQSNILSVAISDFGIGIVNSVREYDSSINSDIEAIEWALKDHSTVKSTTHNKGLGLGIITASATTARVFSGTGLILIKGDVVKGYEISFRFPGTLIYLDIDLSSFDDKEILESFNW